MPAATAEGPSLVVNLNTKLANAGADLMPDFDGRILLIEEMASSSSRAGRAFRHLAALGVFAKVAGLVWSRVDDRPDASRMMSAKGVLEGSGPAPPCDPPGRPWTAIQAPRR